MRKVVWLLVVAFVFTATAAWAGNLDGTYTFKSRSKAGQPDMVGWQGTMTIGASTMDRKYNSPDGKQSKFYKGKLTNKGDLYSLTLTEAYKPEYVGNVHTNKMKLTENTLIMVSPDGKFSETWMKK